MLDKLPVTDHIRNLKVNEIAPKSLFYEKRKKKWTPSTEKRVLSLYFFILSNENIQ